MLKHADFSEEELMGNEKWSFESCFGFKSGSTHPFNGELNFMVEGGASYFLVDRLHVLDGVIDKLWLAFRKLYGPSLERTSISFGNLACGVSTGFHFHKMEESLHDFQFVLLALLYHEGIKPRNGLSEDRRKSHARLALQFLRIVVILKDDAPGFLQSDLEESIQSFGLELDGLEMDLETTKLKVELDTAKMHEILVHVAPQVECNGPASNFSSDAFEWAHAETKRTMRAGSLRRDDQAVTVLKRGYFKASLQTRKLVISTDPC